MRILQVSHGFPPDTVGGVEQHVEGLCGELVAMGHEVEIYTRSAATDRPAGTLVEERDGPCPVTRVVYRFEDVRDLGGLYRSKLLEDAFRTHLGNRRFDVAHVHHLTGLSTGLLDVLADRSIPVALTLHDFWMICPRGQMWHRQDRLCETVATETCADCLGATFPHWLGPGTDSRSQVAALHRRAREALERADALILPSARTRGPFEALGVPSGRLEVVENGVDTAALGGLALPRPEPGAPLRIGYLGTVIPSKGLHVLVAACQRLPAGTAELHVHGNVAPYHGDEGYLTRCLQGLRPGDRVTLHGPYARDELPGILGALDLVAAPALWREAYGLTVREALAAGRPVVVSRIGGLLDAVEDGVEGLTVPPGDVGALARALRSLIEDRPRLLRMAGAARRRPRGFRPMAEDLVRIYRRLASLDPQTYNS